MPYTLITGLPGSAKSLLALDIILKEYKERELFVSGVPGLTIPHQKLDPNEQEEGGDLLAERAINPLIDLPNAAFVWVDECQRVFPPRPSSKTPPPNVRYFEVHRKLGHDGILCTQHPNLLDPNVRKLVGRHLHVVRTLGLERATIYEWNKCKDPDSKADLKLAVTRSYTYPTKLYPLYKSASLHNIKVRIPKLVFLIPAMLIGGVCAAYFGYQFFQKKTLELNGSAPASASSSGAKIQPSQREPVSSSGKASYLDAVGDAKQFVFDRTPRIAALPHTAPRYDSVTAPTTAPVPVSCVSSKTRCTCYSQQATIMDVPDLTCRSIVDRGFFVDFALDKDKQGNTPQQQSQPAVMHADAVPASTVASLDRDGYGVHGKSADGVRKRDVDSKPTYLY